MTLSIREFSPNDLPALRQQADGFRDWLAGQRLHSLIDAYEDREAGEAALTEALEDLHGEMLEVLDPPTKNGKDVAETAKAKIERYETEIERLADQILSLRPNPVTPHR